MASKPKVSIIYTGGSEHGKFALDLHNLAKTLGIKKLKKCIKERQKPFISWKKYGFGGANAVPQDGTECFRRISRRRLWSSHAPL